MTVEGLLLLALFVLLPIVEQLIKRARRRRAMRRRFERATPAVIEPVEAAFPDVVVPPAPAPEPPPARPPSARQRLPIHLTRRDRLRHVGELREAVVLRIILGPCRALNPYGESDRPA